MEIPRHISTGSHPENHREVLMSFFDELKQNHANHFWGIEFSDLGDEELVLLKRYKEGILVADDCRTYNRSHPDQNRQDKKNIFVAGLANLITSDSLQAEFLGLKAIKESRKYNA